MRSTPFVSRLDGKKIFRGLRACSVSALLSWLMLVPMLGQGSTGSEGSTGSTGGTGSGGGTAPTLGYNPLSNTTDPTVNTFYSFVSGSTTGTAFVVPFQVNSLGSSYSLASVSLLLSGTGVFDNMSLSVSATLPTNFTAPTALTTFSTASPGSSPGSSPSAWTFNATTSPTLSSGTTYYLRIGYTGTGTLNWAKTGGGGETGSGGTPALTFIDGYFATNTAITYRQVDANGFTDGYNNIGGFSVTANAVSAIPEPGTSAAIAGAAALLAGLIVRWKRRPAAPTPPATAQETSITE